MKRKTARTNLILEIILWIFSLVTIYPLLMVVMTSFKSKGEASYLNITLPGEWHFENYKEVLEKTFPPIIGKQ